MKDVQYEIYYELYVEKVVTNKVFTTYDKDIFEDMMKRFTVSPFITILKYFNGKDTIVQVQAA